MSLFSVQVESDASALPSSETESADVAFALSWPQWLHYFEQSDNSAERKEGLLLDLKVENPPRPNLCRDPI